MRCLLTIRPRKSCNIEIERKNKRNKRPRLRSQGEERKWINGCDAQQLDAMTAQIKELSQEISENNLSPLWEISEGLFTEEPSQPVRPFLWKGKRIISLLLEVGKQVVPGAEVGRRVLTLIHPDVKQYGGASWNLQVGFQMVKIGERAPPHRHNAQASRFVIRGKASTVIEGERVDMETGDYVLTPGWDYHEHLMDEGDYIIWLDTLDIPFVARQGIAFFQNYPSEWQNITSTKDEITRRATQRNLIPSVMNGRNPTRPFLYKWKDTFESLRDLANHNLTDEYDGSKVSYADPTSPSPGVFPTFGADMTLLKAGSKTKTHRHTSSAVYYVVDGKGSTTINGKRFDWEKHDVLSIPAWAWHDHVNTGNTDAIRLLLTDEPMLRNLDLYKDESSAPQN